MAKRIEQAGPSQRQLRVGELIRRTLAEILARGDHHIPDLEGVLISVGEVRMSTDLCVATVLIYPHGGDGQTVIKALAGIAGRLRYQVSKVTKLKNAAELRFRLDNSYDIAEETQRLIDALPKPGGD